MIPATAAGQGVGVRWTAAGRHTCLQQKGHARDSAGTTAVSRGQVPGHSDTGPLSVGETGGRHHSEGQVHTERSRRDPWWPRACVQ